MTRATAITARRLRLAAGRRSAIRAAPSMRQQVKAVALDLLIRHGYHGVTFADLAKPLKTTRANIHYHFGTKQALVEEVLDDYVRTTLEQLRELWESPDVPLVKKIRRTAEHSRSRYLSYNPTGRTGHPWSLITRMRQDATALTPKCRARLRLYGSDLNAMIVNAIEEAKERGEFASSMPVLDVGLHLVSIANSGGPITQDARSFDRLDHLYSSFIRIITLAFGPEERASLDQDGAARREPGSHFAGAGRSQALD